MRNPQLSIFLGTNGTGKTTLLKQFMQKALESNRRVLVVTPDDIEWQELQWLKPADMADFVGVRKIIFEQNETMQNIYDHFRNGLLVFDDYKAFGIESKNDVKILRQIAVRRRQRMLDIAIAAHGFTEVVPFFLYTFSTHIVLFRTLDNIKRVSHVLRDFNKMVDAQYHVNRKSETDKHFYLIIKQ